MSTSTNNDKVVQAAQPDAPVDAATSTAEPQLTKRDVIDTYIRSTFMLGSFNFERMQATGVLHYSPVDRLADFRCDRRNGGATLPWRRHR